MRVRSDSVHWLNRSGNISFWSENGLRSCASRVAEAPIAAVQTSSTVSPKRSFVGAAANRCVGWEADTRSSRLNDASAPRADFYRSLASWL
jgi:hypothetical protein